MIQRAFAMVALVALAATVTAPPVLAQAAGVKAKVVFQVSDGDPAKWGLVLNNVRNAQVDLGEESLDVEIVAYGPGIAMLKGDSSVAQRVSAALKTGVKVMACENTMSAQHLARTDMLPNISYVPAGVVELILKQQQGYAYIRP
jgi:intracellular sulfur oxidation DsrE/DsrF family protein